MTASNQKNKTKAPSSIGKIVGNFGLLAGSQVLSDLFSFALFVAVTRAFGEDGIGQYSFAVGLASLFVVLSSFGFYHYSIKEMSRHRGELGDYFGGILTIRLILCGISFMCLLALMPWLSFSQETKIIIVIIALFHIISRLVNGVCAVFIASEQMYIAGGIELSLKAISAIAGISIILISGDLVTTLLILPIVAVIHLAIAGWLVRKHHGRLKLVKPLSFYTKMMKEVFPYAQTALLAQLSARLDVIFLGFLLGTVAAGEYNVAYRVIFMLQFIPYFVSISLFPTASRLHVGPGDELGNVYQSALKSAVLVAVPMTTGLWLVAPDVIELLFGAEFIDSAVVVRILCGVLFLMFMTHIMGTVLMAADLQHLRNRGYWIAVLINGTANFTLIPMMGIKGAAFAAIMSEGFLACAFAIWLRSQFGLPRIASQLCIGVLGAALFCSVFGLLLDAPLLIVIPASVLIYACVLSLFPTVRERELKVLMNLVRIPGTAPGPRV